MLIPRCETIVSLKHTRISSLSARQHTHNQTRSTKNHQEKLKIRGAPKRPFLPLLCRGNSTSGYQADHSPTSVFMSTHGKFVENLIKTFLSYSRDGVEDLRTNKQKQFAYKTLVAATGDFDPTFKLGQGGFGSVFKGKLKDGREIAVKRLSQTSNQGKKEFINEAKLLARVQHRNVVSLLGYCAHGEEKLLVYEYVVNDSLDKVLFNADGRRQLDWNKRYDVIVGVARGLLYLHEDTHSCIIHRGIKASNVLLDEKWTPKIADFGMARLYPEDQTHVQTRVAGTNGYMAPEYLMHGQLSVKADVFSYGILVLELISGKKNSSFYMEPDMNSVVEWTWKLYSKRRGLEIMDPTLASTGATDQVGKCIQIALLCVQPDPNQRPSMQRVLALLSKKHGNLEQPMKPGYHGSSYRSTTPVWSSRSGPPSQAASTSASASASNTHTATTSA